MAGRSYARVVTRKSNDGGRAFPRALKMVVELGLFLRRAGRSVMPAARVIVTDLSQVASDAAAAWNRWDLPRGRREADRFNGLPTSPNCDEVRNE